MSCEKICFTKPEAIRIINKNQKRGKQYRKEIRCYFCYEHNCWHLTSKQKDKPEINIKLRFKNKWNKLLKKASMHPISLCLTNYQRYEWTIRAIEQIIDDDRISEVIISDDCSPDDSGKMLADYYKGNSKVKVVIQAANRQMSLNKKMALSYATNSFALLADSDNVFTPSYLDALEVLGQLDENTIYQPCFGEPNFDWTKYEGILINKSNISDFMQDSLFCCSLNGANYVVSPKIYCEKYLHNPDIDAADTIHFLYNWLLQGGNYYIVPGMKYLHTVGEHSGFMKNLEKNMNDAIALEKMIWQLK